MDSVTLLMIHELRHVLTGRALDGNTPLSCRIQSLTMEFPTSYTDSMFTWSYFGQILSQDYIANTCGPLPCSQSEPQLGFTLDQTNKSSIWPTSRFCNCCNTSHECTWWLPDYKGSLSLNADELNQCYILLKKKKKLMNIVTWLQEKKGIQQKYFMWHLRINNQKQIKLFL